MFIFLPLPYSIDNLFLPVLNHKHSPEDKETAISNLSGSDVHT